jgi:hypothetical protein
LHAAVKGSSFVSPVKVLNKHRQLSWLKKLPLDTGKTTIPAQSTIGRVCIHEYIHRVDVVSGTKEWERKVK